MARRWKEEWKTMHDVFDQFAERNLFKLSSQGYFDELKSALSIGKEASVFTALKDDELRILKIYRLSNCDFKKMYQYIKADPRFPNLTNNRRKVVFSWAKREYRNLLKAREAGVRVPTPYVCFFNILVMEFIGREKAAPRLKDSPPDDPESFFDEVVGQMRKLYKADLVHGDLSAFNILNFDEKPVIIDMSQSTTLENPYAKEYLDRDIRNVCAFFSKLGVGCDEDSVKLRITR